MIYPDEKWNPKLKDRNEKIMNDLLEKSLESNPDVIVWPEAALTSFLAVPDSKERIKLQEKNCRFNSYNWYSSKNVFEK